MGTTVTAEVWPAPAAGQRAHTGGPNIFSKTIPVTIRVERS